MNNNIRTYPASLIQEQFWLIQQIHSDSSTYNSFTLFRIKGDLNIEVLEKSFAILLQQHEILRSNFTSESGELLQVVRPCRPFQIHLEDRSTLPVQLKEKLIRNEIDKVVQQPFNLSKDLLLRVKLYKEREQAYILVLVFHHIITDLHSKEVFADQLSALYNQSEEMRGVTGWTDQSIQYRDYAKWQHEFLLSERYKANLSYWKKRLAGVSHYLNLPIDKPRPAIQNLNGSAKFFVFSQEETKAIEKFSRCLRGTSFLICLTAYVVLLYRYSGQREIIVGVPLTNRRHKDYKDTLGCFVNIQPLAVTIADEDISFVDLLRQVRMALLEAHRNQEVPYELLVRELQPERDLSYNPLFQVGFTFEPPMQLSLSNLEVTSEKVHNCGSQLDIFANLWVQNGALHGMFEYDTDLFEPETMERYVCHYKTLLKGIIKQSEESISGLPILSEAERHQLLTGWNCWQSNYVEAIGFHQLFEKQAAIQPEATACYFDGSKLTYGQLDEWANKLANYLFSKGVARGHRVGVYMGRSLDMVVAVLGILKTGAAYVPLDPEFPDDRVAYMIENSGVGAILCHRKNSGQLTHYAGEIVSVDSEWPEIEHCSFEALDSSVSADDLAYVIYTSGSTGKPKGVQVPHRAVVNFMVSMADTPGVSKNDILLAVTTLSFDISVLELFLPLSTGGQVVIAPQSSIADGHALKKLIKEYQITVMQATPITWHLLIAAGWEKIDSFKVLCGGEPMPENLASELLRRATSVWNLYGPTETTIWSTCHQVSADDKAVLVGRPIANTQTYIVDRKGQLTPIGVAGELLIGGAGVTKGYLGRPNLTAEKFTPDIFSNISGGKLYHTGDIATYLPDGSIKLYGREDKQIKLRGYRIELGEIEAALVSCPSVKQAVVILKDFAVGDQRLVAYYTRDEGVWTDDNYRTALRTVLPGYMIPSLFICLDNMPLTANGKIDRSSLPSPHNQIYSDGTQGAIQTGNRVEKELCAIWTDVLHVETVSIYDNFFEIGGDSLLCLKVLGKIEKNLHVKVPTVKFFQYPTIASFSNFLAQSNSEQKNENVKGQAVLRRKALTMQKRRAFRGRV